MGFGKNLESVLSARNMTVTQLARKANVSPTTIYSMISRDGNKVDIDLLLRICDILEVEPEIFAEKSNNEPITLAVHFDGDEYTAEELEEIKKFAEFVKSKRN